MDVKVIRSETDYALALAEIERLMENDPEIDSPQGEKLELLALVVEKYESEEFEIEPMRDYLARVRAGRQRALDGTYPVAT